MKWTHIPEDDFRARRIIKIYNWARYILMFVVSVLLLVGLLKANSVG